MWPLRSLHPGKSNDTLQPWQASFSLLSLHAMTVTFSTARATTIALRSCSAALLVEQKGGEEQQKPDAEPGPHGGAPGAAGDQQRRRGNAAQFPWATARCSVSEGPGVSPAHRPGCGGSEQRPERAARGAPQFVGAAPSPRQCAGGVSKGRTLRRG